MDTTTSLASDNKEFYDKTLLKRLLPNLVYANYGQKKSLPKNSGKIIKFRKYNSLPPVPYPLTEGITPGGTSLSLTEIQAMVDQYGDFVEISDMVDLVGIDPVLTETAELLGEQAGETIDRVIREKISNGTNVRYVGDEKNIAISTNTVCGVMTAKEIQKAVRTLKNDNAKPFDGKYYIGIIDPDISYDLQQDPLFLDVSKYNGGTQIIDGEIGKLGKVRFVETTNTNVVMNSNGKYVHSALIIGKDAYGIVDIEGSSKPEMIIKPHGSSGTSDPLNQRATSGWKALFTAERLNELAMIRIECLTSTEMEYFGNYDGDDTVESGDIIVKTTTVQLNDGIIPQCGNLRLADNTLYISGILEEKPNCSYTMGSNGTHAISLIFLNKTLDNFTSVKYKLNDGEVKDGEENGLFITFYTDSNKNSQKISIAWDGTNYTTEYILDFSNSILR